MASPRFNSFARVDIGHLLPESTDTNRTIKRSLSSARRAADQLRDVLEGLSKSLKELEAQDKLGNMEVQNLMSRFNQAEALASNVLKKRDDTASAIIGKI
mgnify:CR=1 FL=1